MRWRLGLDQGANSIGWAAVRLDDTDKPCGFLALGVRIFSDGRDPQSGTSLAVERRDARSMSRRRDRFKQRQAALLKYLEKDRLFPSDLVERNALAALDPYELRARALDEPLTLQEIGRAIFHLNQRRGFQSNRKADRGVDEDAGKIAVGIDRLRQKIADAEAEAGAEPGSWTFGKWLHERRRLGLERLNPAPDKRFDHSHIPSVRARLRPETGEGAKGEGYDFYPGRDLIKAEFDAIWEAQALHHPTALTEDVYKHLHEIVFGQRKLKAPKVGKCTLPPYEEDRLPKAHPLFQRRRMLEELNGLMIVRAGETAERLTREQRDLLLLKLKDKRRVSFETLHEKVLKLDADARFNKESEHRTELLGDEVAAEMGMKSRFGTRWGHFSPERQWEAVRRLMDAESDADVADFQTWLTETCALTAEQAKSVSNARLPPGYGRFGLTATTALIKTLSEAVDEKGHVVPYDKAVALAGYHHSDRRTGETFIDERGRPALPYYGVALERHIMPGTADHSDSEEMRVGRLTNPTVHISLNQLRRVVNRLIRAYGPPAEIALELARELKLSEEEKRRRNQENTRNRLDAEGRSRKLLGLDKDGNKIGNKIADDTGASRARLKLWEELNPSNVLDRRCIYTGRQISIEMLFSPEVEIDHILPFSATLDDSNGNKIVCIRQANREKRERSPYEAWGHTDRWLDIAERAARLPRNKRWRFEPDAMQRLKEQGGFLARHLVDTQYLGRLARDYLSSLYSGRGEGSSHVWVSTGRLTEMVRRKLGLNDLLPDHNFAGGADQAKNRLDHRHHAIDAAVVAILDRGMLNEIARASGEGADDEEMQKILVPLPWPAFRDDLARAVKATIVSHRPDHGTVSKAGLPLGRDQTAGRLHNDTAYGFTGEVDAKGISIVVHRVPLTSFKKPADIERVRDPVLRKALLAFTAGHDGNAFIARLARFPDIGHRDYRGIRHVRVIEPVSVIPVRDRMGRVYKGYKGDSNYRYDIWELPDGRWQASVVSMFDAHQPGERPRPHPAARKVLSLHRDDVLAIERGSAERELVRVVKFSEKQFAIAPLHEAGSLKARDADKNDPFKYAYPSPSTLKACRARHVRIDELGRVLDPGFPARQRPCPLAAD